MAKKIIILGTGGNCIDILDTLNDINDFRRKQLYRCVGFLDDNERLWGKTFCGIQVLGSLDAAEKYHDYFFVNGIGSPTNFWEKDKILAKTGIPLDRFESIVHPTASVSQMSVIGFGVVVFQHVTITSSVRIGNQVIILPNTVISHDDVIGNYTCIAGGVSLSGNVTVGNSCYIGTNCSIINNTIIGDYCLVGMGSVVLHNIAENSVVVGNPAKFLKRTR
jgi:sugar O-acyltransferase (sialic acid O-acetyltransferase NeuD family)